jgi:phosphate transport system substrate-binding protein
MTYAFTGHLAAVSKAWSNGGPGVGKLIDWPHASMHASGNEGVAHRIKISEGGALPLPLRPAQPLARLAA